jgi:hypothetical protein
MENPYVYVGLVLVAITVWLFNQLNPLVLLLMGGSGADPSQVTSSLMGRVREHLANIYGTPSDPSAPTRNQDAGKKRLISGRKTYEDF